MGVVNIYHPIFFGNIYCFFMDRKNWRDGGACPNCFFANNIPLGLYSNQRDIQSRLNFCLRAIWIAECFIHKRHKYEKIWCQRSSYIFVDGNTLSLCCLGGCCLDSVWYRFSMVWRLARLSKWKYSIATFGLSFYSNEWHPFPSRIGFRRNISKSYLWEFDSLSIGFDACGSNKYTYSPVKYASTYIWTR